METRAHNALIGLFTLAVVAAALGFVVWFARISDSQSVKRYEVDFPGSVSGLSVGSSVTFNGIRVGQVDTLDINPKDPSGVVAMISVKQTTPVHVDTSARLEFASITANGNVQLIGGKLGAPDLVPEAGQEVAVIKAQRSELQNLFDSARDTVNQASSTMDHINTLITQNQDNISQTIQNVTTFTKALADNSPDVSNFLHTTGHAAESIGHLADNLSGMSGDVQKLIQAVSPEKVDHIVTNISATSDQIYAFSKAFDSARAQAAIDNVSSFTKTLADVRDPLMSFATNASSLTAQLNGMAPKLDAGLENIDKLTAAIDTRKINQVVDNVTTFTGVLSKNADQLDGFIKDAHKVSSDLTGISVKLALALDSFNKVAGAIDASKVDSTVDNVSKFAQSLGDSTSQVRQIVADASDVARKLNHTADQLDGIMKNISGMTSSQGGQGMFNEITETAKSIRQLANNLDARTAILSKNLDQFTGSGLRDYQQLAVDGQKTLSNIQRTLNSLQRNPQQLIFGPKSNIPDYKGK
jgi:phospholipid/cholesterol/gamma-HCH transport system substrate-binding protein